MITYSQFHTFVNYVCRLFVGCYVKKKNSVQSLQNSKSTKNIHFLGNFYKKIKSKRVSPSSFHLRRQQLERRKMQGRLQPKLQAQKEEKRQTGQEKQQQQFHEQ